MRCIGWGWRWLWPGAAVRDPGLRLGERRDEGEWVGRERRFTRECRICQPEADSVDTRHVRVRPAEPLLRPAVRLPRHANQELKWAPARTAPSRPARRQS